jgi:hypothetical protein
LARAFAHRVDVVDGQRTEPCAGVGRRTSAGSINSLAWRTSRRLIAVPPNMNTAEFDPRGDRQAEDLV